MTSLTIVCLILAVTRAPRTKSCSSTPTPPSARSRPRAPVRPRASGPAPAAPGPSQSRPQGDPGEAAGGRGLDLAGGGQRRVRARDETAAQRAEEARQAGQV